MLLRRRKRREEQLLLELRQLVELLRHEAGKEQKQTVQIQIDELHVEKLQMDELMFRLDKLDIEELSGALNLGNNFGTKVWHPSQTDHQVKAVDAKAVDTTSEAIPAEQCDANGAGADDERQTWKRTGSGYAIVLH
ncbi:hypothetical protein [Alicyclobacillus fodiniaquatilis]|jgi:hypothetical protein|uniref:Uncharacterized protein n=1 Tax=Alicyclobacillus fodiniaquatilis TaxID=1661150 RepID=A0ABW4JCY9_9BACL